MYAFSGPDQARDLLRDAIEYLVDEDGYSRPDIEQLCASEIELVFEEL